MFTWRQFHIEPAAGPALTAAGLADFDALNGGEVGRLIKDKKGTQVRRLELPEGVFYLKRSRADPFVRTLHALLGGLIRGLIRGRCRAPMVRCYREMLMARALAAAGIAVMRPVAWGQRRVLGVPRDGFMLTEEVRGEEFINLFNRLQGAQRRRAAAAMAQLLGRLHLCGFYPSIRLRDLIVTDAAALSLTLIDCETSAPRPRGRRPCEPGRCLAALARCYLKNQPQMQSPLSGLELLAALRAYHAVVRERWPVSRRDLWFQVRRTVERLSGPGGKYHTPGEGAFR